jgi:energy-coupling factor transporter ATP-binding protein EcfA2
LVPPAFGSPEIIDLTWNSGPRTVNLPYGLDLDAASTPHAAAMSIPPTIHQIQGPAIHVQGLEKSYGKLRVLRGVDLDVARGSIVALLGPNGAGKTTAVRLLTTLLRPDAGSARVAGHDLLRDPAASGGVAILQILQPLVRTWGRMRHAPIARKDLPPWSGLQGPARRAGRGVILLPADHPRADVASAIVGALRRTGMRVMPPTGWEDYDARLLGSTLVDAEVITSGYPLGAVQVRVRPRVRVVRVLITGLAVATAAGWSLPAAAAVFSVAALELLRGAWRTGPLVRRTIERAARMGMHPTGPHPHLPTTEGAL